MIRKILIAALAVTGLVFGSALQAKAETVIVVTTQNQVFTFDSATPGTTTVPVAISGLVSGSETIDVPTKCKRVRLSLDLPMRRHTSPKSAL